MPAASVRLAATLGWYTSLDGIKLARSIPPPIHIRQPWQPRVCPIAAHFSGLQTGYTPPEPDYLDQLLAAFTEQERTSA